MVEMIVDCLEIVRLPPNARPDMENCVKLNLPNTFLDIQMCDEDMKAALDVRDSKKGKCCFFYLTDFANIDLMAVLSVYKRNPELKKLLVGKTSIPMTEVFETVTRRYAGDEISSDVSAGGRSAPVDAAARKSRATSMGGRPSIMPSLGGRMSMRKSARPGPSLEDILEVDEGLELTRLSRQTTRGSSSLKDEDFHSLPEADDIENPETVEGDDNELKETESRLK